MNDKPAAPLILAIAAGLTSAGAVSAQNRPPPELLTLQPAHSSVQFTSRFMRVVRVPGLFHRVHATIAYDTADVTRSVVAAVIETGSLDTDNEARDAHSEVSRLPRRRALPHDHVPQPKHRKTAGRLRSTGTTDDPRREPGG